MTKYQPDTL